MRKRRTCCWIVGNDRDDWISALRSSIRRLGNQPTTPMLSNVAPSPSLMSHPPTPMTLNHPATPSISNQFNTPVAVNQTASSLAPSQKAGVVANGVSSNQTQRGGMPTSTPGAEEAHGHSHTRDVPFTPNIVHEAALMPSSLPTAHSILATPLSRSASPTISSSSDTSPHQVCKLKHDPGEAANTNSAAAADKSRVAAHDDGYIKMVHASASTSVRPAALGDAETGAHAHAGMPPPDVLAHASNVRASEVQAYSGNQRQDAVRALQVRSHEHTRAQVHEYQVVHDTSVHKTLPCLLDFIMLYVKLREHALCIIYLRLGST